MSDDWMKEFELIKLPHVEEYVEACIISRRVLQANKRFDDFYNEAVKRSASCLNFNCNVKTMYYDPYLAANASFIEEQLKNIDESTNNAQLEYWKELEELC